MFNVFVPEAPPVIPPFILGADQLYIVPTGTIPFTPLIGFKVNVSPLQTSRDVLLISDVGLTTSWKGTSSDAPLVI